MTVDEIVQDITMSMEHDGGANYIQLTEQLGVIGTITEVILGLLVTIVLIGMPIVIAIEVIYINFPVAKQSLDKFEVKTTGRFNKVLGLVMHDARIALMRANTIHTGKSVNAIYFGIKCKAIFIAVLSAGLVIGAGPAIIQLILSLAKAFIGGFNMAN